MPLKIKRSFFSIVFLCFYTLISAQAVQTKEPNYRDPVLDRQFGIVAEINAKPAGVEGTNYLSTEWNIGNIYMKSGDTLKNFPLMFDVDNRNLEIKVKDVIKVLPSEQLIAFEWQDKAGQRSSFINSEYYTLDGSPLVGVFEILVAGEIQLLSRTEVDVKKSNYNVAMDVGSRSDRILKKEKLYLARDKKLIELKGKDDFSVFGDKQESVMQYAKENKLKLSRKEDAVCMIGYYNKL